MTLQLLSRTDKWKIARAQLTEAALDMWTLFIPPALASSPSALSRLPPGVPSIEASSLAPEFTEAHFQQWLDFQKSRNKAVSKDTWSLLVDFIRSIDKDFKEYDDSGERWTETACKVVGAS